jgi:hypothetical protein
VYLRHNATPIEDNIIDSTDVDLTGISERMKMGEKFSNQFGSKETGADKLL